MHWFRQTAPRGARGRQMLGLREVRHQKPGEGEKAGTERRREGPSAHTRDEATGPA